MPAASRTEAAAASLAGAVLRLPGLLRAPSPLVVVSDFDGTLAGISPDPMAATIEPLGQRALRRLARIAAARPERLRLVVLSGRTALDVAGRVRVGGVRYLGNHGLEGGLLVRGGRAERLRIELDEWLEPYVGPCRRIGEAVRDRVREPWLFVEPKGPLVAFHYRTAPDPTAARAEILAAIAAAEADPTLPPHGLVRIEGRRVIELKPADAGGKGAAVERVLERLRPGAIMVLGDDRSDAEAFRVVAAARAAGRPVGLNVAVQAGPETPPEVAESADVVLAAPPETARLLAALARLLEAEASTAAGSTAEEQPAGA
ncbi:MAG TPA: trehalose-phosphatase [Candidatus Limnocylindrales bacterium]